jgi:hypothetical protein
LVSEDLTGGVGGHARSIAEVGAFAGEVRGWAVISSISIHVSIEEWQLGGQFWHWAQVLAMLVKVAFDGGNRLGQVMPQVDW